MINLDLDAAKDIYLALDSAPPSFNAIRSIAKLRLALIEAVGEEQQRELIGQWNELANGIAQDDLAELEVDTTPV